MQSGTFLAIYSNGAGDNSPTPAGREYTIYYLPPQGLEGTELDTLYFSIDMKSLDDTDDSSGALKNVINIF